jgi:hypothetical protein
MGALITWFSGLVEILQNALGGTYIYVTYLFGLGAMVFAISSFQAKKRITILIMQLIAHSFWTLYFTFNGAFVGAVLNLLSLLRCVVFSYKDKYKWAKSYFWLGFFIVATIVITILTWSKWYDVLPIIGTVALTFGFYMTSEKHIRLLSLIGYPMWLSYGICTASYVAIVNDGICFISLIISIIRFHLPKKEK